MVLHKLVKFHYQTVYFPSCSVKYEKLNLYYLKNKKSFQSEIKKGSPLKLQKTGKNLAGTQRLREFCVWQKCLKLLKKIDFKFCKLTFFCE